MRSRVSIVITRYAEPDDLVRRSLAAASGQDDVNGEVLFIDQMPDSGISELDFAGTALPVRIISASLSGLSAARNLGIENARSNLVLFLDADAIADPGWAATMARALGGPYAVAGSRILPGWPAEPPFYARAGIVIDQYSMFDLGPATKPYPRVVGAAFGIDKDKLPSGLRFSEALGRRGGKLFSGEESDFCARAREAGARIAYVGECAVVHLVQSDLIKLGWILRRFYYAGLSRSHQGGTPSPASDRGLWDWIVLPLVLPPYALGWARGKLRRG